MQAFFYARVSHRQSAASGVSEEAQFAAMIQHYSTSMVQPTVAATCYPYDLPPGHYCDRGVSAWSVPLIERPAAGAMLEQVSPGDTIYFYDVDRAFRSVRDYAKTVEGWLDNNITPVFVANGIDLSTPGGKLMGHCLAAFAQYYSDVTSARTREALAIRKMTQQQPKKKQEKSIWLPSDVKFASNTPKVELEEGRIMIYCRCSHADQEISGLGMEHQRRSCRKYAERLASARPGLEILDENYEDDSVSAFSVPFSDRPSGKKLVSDARRGDHVVMYRMDRGFRDELDAARTVRDLLNRGIVVHLVDQGINSASEFGLSWFSIMASFASIESQIKSRRSKDVKEYLKANGRPWSSIPKYCTVRETSDGKKKLTTDLKRINSDAMAWVLWMLGCRGIAAYRTATAHLFMDEKLRPRTKAWTSRYLETHRRANDSAIDFDRFIESGTVPMEVIEDCVLKAVRKLKRPIVPPYDKMSRGEEPWKRLDGYSAEELTEAIMSAREAGNRLKILDPTSSCATS